MKDSEIDKLIENTLNEFVKQFGTLDDNTRLVLETIFEICCGEENAVPVLGEKRQEGNQNPNDIQRRTDHPNFDRGY